MAHSSRRKVQGEPQPLSNRRPGEHLYFVRVKDGPVKIGRATDVGTRLKCLQCASPYELVLVGVMNEGGEYEGVFHCSLDSDRIRGEWFEWTEQVATAAHEAITNGKWRTALGIEELKQDWWHGSPLYELISV